MKNIIFIGIAIAVLFTQGCSNGSASEKNGTSASKKTGTVNIILLLDLSNRIIAEGQSDKDQKILQEVLSIFEARQKRQAYITSNDRLMLLIAAQPGVNVSSNDELVIDMANLRSRKNGQSIGRSAFVEAHKKFDSALVDLYNKALSSPYTGADIYTFFCSDYPVNFMSTVPNVKNKVILLTDGYLSFDPQYLSQRPQCSYMRKLTQLRQAKQKWQDYFVKNNLALCPCGKNYTSTEVMLLETAPLNKGTSVFEFDIVKHYWKNWFDAMNVPVSIYPQQDQVVTSISDKIEAFLE